MLGLKRLIPHSFSVRASIVASQRMKPLEQLCLLPSQHLAQMNPKRFLDIYQLGNKAAIEKERARLADEMSRGYFADIAELEKHGGKIALANKVIIPAMVAVKFPDLEANFSDGKKLKLPIRTCGNEVNADKSSIPKASLVCLSFRANAQAMINSWSGPFVDAFGKSKDIHLYETMKRTIHDESKELQRQMVYSFGDHYYFRKELRILNLLIGYIFLLDKFGRIRWQGFGFAKQDELSSLLSCTSLLLEE